MFPGKPVRAPPGDDLDLFLKDVAKLVRLAETFGVPPLGLATVWSSATARPHPVEPYCQQTALAIRDCATPRALALQAFQFLDHALDHAKAALPEGRIAGVEAEGSEQLGVMLGAAG